MFESLEEDRHSRRAIASERPSLDLGLKLTEMLAKVPIFASLKEDQIARLAQMLTPELFTPGERIIRAGDQGDKMYFIASGVVDVLVAPDPVRLKSRRFLRRDGAARTTSRATPTWCRRATRTCWS